MLRSDCKNGTLGAEVACPRQSLREAVIGGQVESFDFGKCGPKRVVIKELAALGA